MKVACGQEKSKTGSSVRSHANPRKRQALSRRSSAYGLQAARRSRLLARPRPWARPVQVTGGWQPNHEDNRVPPTLPTQECRLPWRWKPGLQEHL